MSAALAGGVSTTGAQRKSFSIYFVPGMERQLGIHLVIQSTLTHKRHYQEFCAQAVMGIFTRQELANTANQGFKLFFPGCSLTSTPLYLMENKSDVNRCSHGAYILVCPSGESSEQSN